MSSSNLYRSLINDRATHPERFNTSWERLAEVLAIVIGDQADKLLSELAPPDDTRQSVTEAEAESLVGRVESTCSGEQIKRLTQMLRQSEIATAEAIELHEEFKIPVSRLEKDIVPVSGEGAWITDTRGKTYLDMDSNYSATNLGMANQEIALGLFNQARQLISMKEDRVHIPRTRFLKSIHQMLPTGLTQFYWQNSGGEAVDKALKIAKAFTQHKGVVAMKGGFHGRTHGAVAVTHEEKYRRPFMLDNEDWVHFVEFNDLDAIEKLFNSGKAKSVILELVQGEEAGIRPASREFAKQLREMCNQHGCVMIVDEIQTGFGRTAEKPGQWFASMVYDIVPDIMTIGKSFGGGYPVTAVVTTKQISAAMQPGYDGSTFGGNPMAMVAALIATRQMREKDITGNVVKRSQQIMDGLRQLQGRHESIVEMRGLGLMIALKLPVADLVPEFQRAMADNGVKTSLSTREWIRFLPPLIITAEEVDHLLQAIDKSLERVAQPIGA
ncbi:MAG: aminotransferase class III-fold pyridoxal phosphate-dependent enzyme [bacterium]